MKVIAVLGSPREQSASSAVAMQILEGAKSAGHEIVLYRLNQMNLRGCQACRYCKENCCDCIVQDDLKPYWHDLHTCGALILASPNYCSQVTGPMISFMNRHYCLSATVNGKAVCRLEQNIKLVGVFSQGNGNPQGYLENYRWYLRNFEAKNMTLEDILVHTPQMSLEKDGELMRRAYAIGQAL